MASPDGLGDAARQAEQVSPGFGYEDRKPGEPVRGSEPQAGEVVVADRWFPSSRRCRKCDVVSVGLMLKDRVFRCENAACGHVEDRDIHAARNLERYPGLPGNLTPVDT